MIEPSPPEIHAEFLHDLFLKGFKLDAFETSYLRDHKDDYLKPIPYYSDPQKKTNEKLMKKFCRRM